MSTTNAFALLSTEASDSKIAIEEKKKKEQKKAPKKVAVPAKKPEGVKAPKDVRGSSIPDSALEQKRSGKPSESAADQKRGKGPRKLSIQRNNAGTGKRPPKREFDRHDGTGRAHEGAKKQGAGRGNWGKPTDHVEEEKPEEEKEEKTEKPEEPELSEEEKAAMELRAKQRTVDQYRKEQKGVKTILRSAAAVEVECSVDEKNFAPLNRVDLAAEQEKLIAAEKPKKAAKPEKTEKAPKKAAKREEAVIEIKFNEPGRREHLEKSPRPVAKVDVTDKEAFPSL